VFFVTWLKTDMFVATGVFMGAITIALVVAWVRDRKVPRMLLFTAVIVVILGALTLFLGETKFIQLKPTIVYCLFAVILGTGLVTGRLFLKPVFGASFKLTDRGWKLLTYRWIGFFLVLAVLNEIVRREFSETVWMNFKFWGIVVLILVFTMLQVPFLTKHAPPDEEGAES